MQQIGKYQVLEKIGVGGFGEVFKGYDPFIKRPVAIKTCSSADQEIRHRFFQEAEIAGNLHHRNITTVYDFGVQDDLPYLIQEYLGGEDLDRKIKRRDFLPYPEKLYYLLQIARGLACAHGRGVIHRDIKPANIRILADGTVKIMDFGIAKLAQQESGLTQTGMTVGTASYLAPEQIRGEAVSLETDVFSFGVLAYELLTYQRPFDGEQISQVLYRTLHEDPPPVSEIWPAAPAEIVSLISCCLQKSPKKRYTDGSFLLRELETEQRRGRGERDGLSIAPEATLGATGEAAVTIAAPTPAVVNTPPTAAVTADGITVRTTVQTPARTPTASTPDASQAQTLPRSVRQPLADTAPLSPPAPPAEHRAIDAFELNVRPGTGPVIAQHTDSEGPALLAKAASLLIPLMLLILAGAVGWWLGKPSDDPPPAIEVPTVAAASPAGAISATDEFASTGADPANEPALADATPPPATADVNAEDPPVPETPPASGVVYVAATIWTDAMTLEIGGRRYPLDRARRLELPPGSYTATFALTMSGYERRGNVNFTLSAGQEVSLIPPISEPGALRALPFPGKPQAMVFLDGEALGSSPILRQLKEPGEYHLEIRPLEGDGAPLGQPLTIEPGRLSLITFDLDKEDLTVKSNDLERQP